MMFKKLACSEYKKKPPTFPEKIPDEIQVTIYADRGYQGAPEVPGGTLCTPIKKKKGAKLNRGAKGIQQNPLKDSCIRRTCNTQGQDLAYYGKCIQESTHKIRPD